MSRRAALEAAALAAIALALLGCRSPAPDPSQYGTADRRLRAVSKPLIEPVARRTVYVPVYSRVELGDPRRQSVALTCTVTVRNVSSRYALHLEAVRSYYPDGRHIRDHIRDASELPPLSVVDFVVPRPDGGLGSASFVIQWAGPTEIDDPVVEAVMIGQSGNVGIAFTSVGRSVANERPK